MQTTQPHKDANLIAVEMNSYSRKNKNTKTQQLATCAFHTANNFRRDVQIPIVSLGDKSALLCQDVKQ
jgi:uncharacterized Zn-finger protein